MKGIQKLVWLLLAAVLLAPSAATAQIVDSKGSGAQSGDMGKKKAKGRKKTSKPKNAKMKSSKMEGGEMKAGNKMQGGETKAGNKMQGGEMQGGEGTAH